MKRAAAAEHEPSLDFLGREFLLWLWYQFESAGGLYELAGLGRVGVAFDALMELRSADTEGRTTLRGDLPTRLPEAAAALRVGRQPARARLIVACGPQTVEVTLDADTFDLLSMSVVAEAEASDEKSDAQAELACKAKILLDVPRILDSLFLQFLRSRLESTFESELGTKLRHWIRTRSNEGQTERASSSKRIPALSEESSRTPGTRTRSE